MEVKSADVERKANVMSLFWTICSIVGLIVIILFLASVF